MPQTKEQAEQLLLQLGAKQSTSEEHGLAKLSPNDLTIFSPGISTAGFAEIRMVQDNPDRRVVATTIDEKGLIFAREIIEAIGLTNQIETKLEDLRESGEYPDNFFDFIYARLVLHYLSAQDLDIVLAEFKRTVKPNGKLFIVVRSEKNITESSDEATYDEATKLTSIPHYHSNGELRYLEVRYFHSPETIREHLEKAGFTIVSIEEYQEHLYKDFQRSELSDRVDHVIEVQATKIT